MTQCVKRSSGGALLGNRRAGCYPCAGAPAVPRPVGDRYGRLAESRGGGMETRRGILSRVLRGAISGAAPLLLAACSGPARVVSPTPTATTIAPTATLVPTPTMEPTREP